MSANKRALIVIDIQNDYFPGGQYPLWNAEGTLANIEAAVAAAKAKDIPVVIVRHVAAAGRLAPFFNAGTAGAGVHARLLAAAPGAPLVVKSHADSFHETALAATLTELGVDELLVCGMMTQNCVTHTAISRAAEPYRVTVLGDCCTTVDELLHHIALHALSPRVTVATAAQAI